MISVRVDAGTPTEKPMLNQRYGERFVIRNTSDTPDIDPNLPSAFITSLFIAAPKNGSPAQLEVSGFSKNNQSIRIKANLNNVEFLDKQITLSDSDLVWNISGEIPYTDGALNVLALAPDGSNIDSALVHVLRERQPLPQGKKSKTEFLVNDVLAGQSDRIINTRSFGLIEHQNPFAETIAHLEALDAVSVVAVEAETGYAYKIDIDSLKIVLHEIYDEQLASEDVGVVTDTKMRERLINSLDSKAKLLLDENIEEDVRMFADRALKRKSGIEYDAGKNILAFKLPSQAVSNAPDIKPLFKQSSVIASLVAFGPSQIGVSFSERFRYRAAGLVRGEPIYSLSLDAGEEVEIRQSSETVLATSAENVREFESILENTLSSVWSTDVTSAFNESFTENTDWNIGTQAGFSGAEKVPVNVGFSGGLNANSASANTAEVASKNSIEFSRKATSRLRAQHRIKLDVQNTSTIGAASIRTLHNRDAIRPRRIDFYKMYRKELATYERFDARMCLRLSISDPAAEVRAHFNRNMNSIDPDNETHFATLDEPVTDSIDAVTTIVWRPKMPVGINPLDSAYSKENLTIDIKGDSASSIPSNYRLVKSPIVKMVSMKQYLKIFRPPIANVDEEFEFTVETNGTVQGRPNFTVLRRFDDDPNHNLSNTENDLRWSTPPTVNSNTGTALLSMKYINFTNAPIFNLAKSITEVVLEISSVWAPPTAEMEEYQQQREDIKSSIAANRQQSDLYRFRDIAISDYLGTVIASAMRENFTSIDPLYVAKWFDLKTAYVENAPYWATELGKTNHDDLRESILNINDSVPFSDILVPELTSSQATIFIPINHGYEVSALQILGRYTENQIQNLVQNFKEYHDDNFSSTEAANGLLTYEDLDSPAALTATVLGSDSWMTNWEQTQYRYTVLAQWAELIPTDGIDCSTELSPSSSADEAMINKLIVDPTQIN